MKETWSNIVVIALLLGATYMLISQIREKHASYVYALWVGFAAAFILPFPIAWIANKKHWISSNGEFLGDWGERLEKSMNIMVDVSGELALLACIIGLIIAIQFFAYIFAAPSGCATDFRFVSKSISTSTLLFLKSLVSAGGIFLSLLCNNAIYEWDVRLFAMGWDIATLAFVTIFVSFGLLLAYFEVPTMIPSAVRFTRKHCPTFHTGFGRIHRTATKYQKNKASGKDIVDLIQMSAAITRIAERHANENEKRREDVRQLLDLVADVASFDARRTDKSSNEDIAIRNQKQAQIEELREKWSV
jgi:hypothetical protein